MSYIIKIADFAAQLMSDSLVKADRPGHKYISKRPDGKGGWIYTYRKEDGSTYTSGDKPVRDVEQWHATLRGARSRLQAQMAKHPQGGEAKHHEKLAHIERQMEHVKKLRAAGHKYADDTHIHDEDKTPPPPPPEDKKPEPPEEQLPPEEELHEPEKKTSRVHHIPPFKDAELLKHHILNQIPDGHGLQVSVHEGTVRMHLMGVLYAAISRSGEIKYNEDAASGTFLSESQKKHLARGRDLALKIIAGLGSDAPEKKPEKKPEPEKKPPQPQKKESSARHLDQSERERMAREREEMLDDPDEREWMQPHEIEETRREIQLLRDPNIEVGFKDDNDVVALGPKKKTEPPKKPEPDKKPAEAQLSNDPQRAVVDAISADTTDAHFEHAKQMAKRSPSGVRDAVNNQLHRNYMTLSERNIAKLKELRAIASEAIRSAEKKPEPEKKPPVSEGPSPHDRILNAMKDSLSVLHGKGKLTTTDRSPDPVRVRDSLNDVLRYAKHEGTTQKQRNALLDEIRVQLKVARAHAKRMQQAHYAHGSTVQFGDVLTARQSRDLLDQAAKRLRNIIVGNTVRREKTEAPPPVSSDPDHKLGTVKDGKIHLAGREEMIVTPHAIHGDWAAHETSGGGYGVTHIPTGLLASRGLNKSGAASLAKRLHSEHGSVSLGKFRNQSFSAEHRNTLRQIKTTIDAHTQDRRNTATPKDDFKPASTADFPDGKLEGHTLRPGSVHKNAAGTVIVAQSAGRGRSWLRFLKKIGADGYHVSSYKTQTGAMRGGMESEPVKRKPAPAPAKAQGAGDEHLTRNIRDVISDIHDDDTDVTESEVTSRLAERARKEGWSYDPARAREVVRTLIVRKGMGGMGKSDQMNYDPALRAQFRIDGEDSLSKGLYKFAPYSNGKMGKIPDEYLVPYLDAFIEEAYEHESRELAHSAPKANTLDGDVATYWSRFIFNELVCYMACNENLKRAATQLRVTAEYVADRLRAMGCCATQAMEAGVASYGYGGAVEAATGVNAIMAKSAAQRAESVNVAFLSEAEGAEFPYLVNGLRKSAEDDPLVQLAPEPYAPLIKSAPLGPNYDATLHVLPDAVATPDFFNRTGFKG